MASNQQPKTGANQSQGKQTLESNEAGATMLLSTNPAQSHVEMTALENGSAGFAFTSIIVKSGQTLQINSPDNSPVQVNAAKVQLQPGGTIRVSAPLTMNIQELVSKQTSAEQGPNIYVVGVDGAQGMAGPQGYQGTSGAEPGDRGGQGGSGGSGSNGSAGGDALDANLNMGTISGLFVIEAHGGNGGSGGAGGAGGTGGNGGPNYGDGGIGGSGGQGGDGGNAGNGSKVVIYYETIAPGTQIEMDTSSKGGAGGTGGAGGIGGFGTNYGIAGSPGAPGNDGRSGTQSAVIFQQQTS